MQVKINAFRSGDLLRAINNDARSGDLQIAMRTEGAQQVGANIIRPHTGCAVAQRNIVLTDVLFAGVEGTCRCQWQMKAST